MIAAKVEFKKGKSNTHKVESARKNATMLINDLTDYAQRRDLVALERNRIRLKYKESGKNSVAELLICNGQNFLFKKNTIQKITDKIQNSNMREVSGALEQKKEAKEIEISPKVFELLKKELGEFQIVL